MTLMYMNLILASDLCNAEQWKSCLAVWNNVPSALRTPPFDTCFCHGNIIDQGGCKIRGDDCKDETKKSCEKFCSSARRGLCTGTNTCIIVD